MPQVHNPTVRRRELGALLRELRQERGMAVEQVAGVLLCSPSKVSRIETGQRGATLRDVRDLCEIKEQGWRRCPTRCMSKAWSASLTLIARKECADTKKSLKD